jgi:pimeloyl-ACP methyl ester carboxylesterase
MDAQTETRSDPRAAGSATIAGIKLEMIRRGRGRPILFLHPSNGIEPEAPFLDLLAKDGEVFAPSHPGFGASELGAGMSNIDDLAYYYLDFLEELDLHDVLVVGVSFGGWLAAEIAIKSTARLSKLVLIDSVGIKVSDRETRDIADLFALTPDEIAELVYHDPTQAQRDLTQLPDDVLRSIARNREASARFGWSPYMHDPKLKQRLHRIDVPALFLWGESDRVVKPDYGRAFAGFVPGARFELIAKAGHAPHVEQPEATARKILAFAKEAAPHVPSKEVA